MPSIPAPSTDLVIEDDTGDTDKTGCAIQQQPICLKSATEHLFNNPARSTSKKTTEQGNRSVAEQSQSSANIELVMSDHQDSNNSNRSTPPVSSVTTKLLQTYRTITEIPSFHALHEIYINEPRHGTYQFPNSTQQDGKSSLRECFHRADIVPLSSQPLHVQLQSYVQRWGVWASTIEDEQRRKEVLNWVGDRMNNAWDEVIKIGHYPLPPQEPSRKNRKRAVSPRKEPAGFAFDGSRDSLAVTRGELAEHGVSFEMIQKRVRDDDLEDGELLLSEVLDQLDGKITCKDWSANRHVPTVYERNLLMYCLFVVQESRIEIQKFERLFKHFTREVQRKNTRSRINVYKERAAQHLALAIELHLLENDSEEDQPSGISSQQGSGEVVCLQREDFQLKEKSENVADETEKLDSTSQQKAESDSALQQKEKTEVSLNHPESLEASNMEIEDVDKRAQARLAIVELAEAVLDAHDQDSIYACFTARNVSEEYFKTADILLAGKRRLFASLKAALKGVWNFIQPLVHELRPAFKQTTESSEKIKIGEEMQYWKEGIQKHRDKLPPLLKQLHGQLRRGTYVLEHPLRETESQSQPGYYMKADDNSINSNNHDDAHNDVNMTDPVSEARNKLLNINITSSESATQKIMSTEYPPLPELESSTEGQPPMLEGLIDFLSLMDRESDNDNTITSKDIVRNVKPSRAVPITTDVEATPQVNKPGSFIVRLKIGPAQDFADYGTKKLNEHQGFFFRYLPNATLEQRQKFDEWVHDYITTMIKQVGDSGNNRYGGYVVLVDPRDKDDEIAHGVWSKRDGKRPLGYDWFFNGEEKPWDFDMDRAKYGRVENPDSDDDWPKYEPVRRRKVRRSRRAAHKPVSAKHSAPTLSASKRTLKLVMPGSKRAASPSFSSSARQQTKKKRRVARVASSEDDDSDYMDE